MRFTNVCSETPARCQVTIFEKLRTYFLKIGSKNLTIFLKISPHGCTGIPKQKIVQTKNPFPDVAFTSSIRGTDHVGCVTLKLFRNIGLWLSIHRREMCVSTADYVKENDRQLVERRLFQMSRMINVYI